MPSNTNASANPTRDMSSISPDERRTTSSTFSISNNRHSYASSETGESSTAASKRNSQIDDEPDDLETKGGLKHEIPVKDDRGSHRSHRSRTSGGFLLSSATFEPPQRDITPPTTNILTHRGYDAKGKGAVRGPETKHKKRKSNLGLGLGGSPLAGNVTNAPQEGEVGVGDRDKVTRRDAATEDGNPTAGVLDTESTQLVNLALNLSESRRNASRRLVSSPLPTPVAHFGENLAGSSMRYHMQQQRRASRNVSPKPDRGERNSSAVPRVPSGKRMSMALQPAFDIQPQEGTYQYHFSASTLARAEKAKKAIELMAQYRELLQYLPPLKPQRLERATTASTINSVSESLLPPAHSLQSNRQYSQQPLGRQYNPLQYIRNRKVRARNGKSIDGEAQGFADVDKVTNWVREVSKEAPTPEYQAADCLPLPSPNLEPSSTGQPTSPSSTLGRNTAPNKSKRPRIDWMTNPADMLADVYWLEQNSNKKLIEDRQGRRIFPHELNLKRPVSRQDVKQELPRPLSQPTKAEDPEEDHQSDAKLPEFKSIKVDNENHVAKRAARAKEKLRHVRNVAKIHHHTHDDTGIRQRLGGSRSKSDLSSSGSESEHRPQRKRSDTADIHDRGKDILEKQMAELLERESKKPVATPDRDVDGTSVSKHFETQKPLLRDEVERFRRGSASHSRSASLANKSKRDSVMNTSSGRASLEVPGTNPRGSLDLDLDTTAPSSPEVRARRGSNPHVPSISMDLTSPHSRHTSPSRSALSKVKAKIRPHREPSYHSDHFDEDTTVISQTTTMEQSETPESRRRSISPIKRLVNKTPGDTPRTRRDKTEDSSGIRGFLKSARNPVSRVSGILWKKEGSPGHAASSSISTDESDLEDTHGSREKEKDDPVGAGKFDDLASAYPPKDRPSYFSDMPTFKSPFDRGRPAQSRDGEDRSQPLTDVKTDKSKQQESSEYPHIKIQPPASPDDRVRSQRRRSSVSNSDSRRGSHSNGVEHSGQRLNSLLGYPGMRREANLPVTGLTGLGMSHDRRPSMQGQRQWSISDQSVSVIHGPTTRRDIARVRALLLSSGIKAKEISRRETTPREFNIKDVALPKDQLVQVAKSQEHMLAAQIISNEIQLSSRVWQESADTFSNVTVADLLISIGSLQGRVTETLTPLTRVAADEADEASKDIVSHQTLVIKRISEKIDRMTKNRRKRFRWLRRGGWVLLEWSLVGVMWYVWFVVVLLNILRACWKGNVRIVRWLLFL